MPSIITRGAITIKAFGFSGTSKSGGFLGLLKNSTNNTNQSGTFGIVGAPSGNVYIGGAYNNSVLTNSAVVKYSSAAVLQWQMRSYDSGPGYATTAKGIAIDSSENVYTAGDGVKNPAGTAAPALNIWKYNSSGALQAQYNIDFYASGYTPVISIDGSSNVYITYGAGGSARVVKLNSSFAVQWGRSLDATSVNAGVDTSGNVFWVAFSGSPFTPTLVKYNSSGTLQWQRVLSNGASVVQPGFLAVDSSGNCYASGYSDTSGSYFGYVAKYNSSGTLQWQRKISDGANTFFTIGVACDANDNVYAICNSSTGFAFIKYDSSGTLQWQRKLTASTGNFSVQSGSVSGKLLYFGGLHGSSYNLFFGAIPTDGSGAGSYVLDGVTFTYAASSYTDAAGSLTDAAGSRTSSSSTPTLVTGTLASATASMTSATVLL